MTITIIGPEIARGNEILTPAAVEFVAGLHRRFVGRRDELLAARARRRPGGAIAHAQPLASMRSTRWKPRGSRLPRPARVPPYSTRSAHFRISLRAPA